MHDDEYYDADTQEERAPRDQLEMGTDGVVEQPDESVIDFPDVPCVDEGNSSAHIQLLLTNQSQLFTHSQETIQMESKQNILCKLHTLRAVQIGSCIACSSSCAICETKGCIKHHEQSEKMHNIYTIKEVQKIAEDYTTANKQKRHILKKIVYEYFQLLKSEVERLYNEVDHSLDNLRFENFLMDQEERQIAQNLVRKRYNILKCSSIARVIPKMLKCSSLQDKQFNHIKDFLYSQKQNLPKTVNSMILNLPYFRQDQTIIAVEKFTQISDELLSNVNKKLEQLNFRPKKLRIKYSDDDGIELERQKFIKLLENSKMLKEVEVLEFFCVYGLPYKKDFQIDFMDAVLSYPFLSALTIKTGYKVTSTAYIEEMVENKNIELKVYKNDWHF